MMNREILFRGLRQRDGEWAYGFYFSEKTELATRHYIASKTGTYAVDPESVGQYAGLTDKNGERIFEGDIIAGSYGIPPIGLSGEVEWLGCAFMVKTPKHTPQECLLSEMATCIGEIKIVGSKYLNPELLKGVSDG